MDVSFEIELLKERIEELEHQVNSEANRAENFWGMLAVERNLVGAIMIGMFKDAFKDVETPLPKQVTSQIDKLLSFMTLDEKIAIKGAVEFNFNAKRYSGEHSELDPSWRDQYPLSQIEKLDFMHIVKRYYDYDENYETPTVTGGF